MAKDARQGVDKADARLEQFKQNAESELSATAKKTEKELNRAVDKFDKNVEEVSLTTIPINAEETESKQQVDMLTITCTGCEQGKVWHLELVWWVEVGYFQSHAVARYESRPAEDEQGQWQYGTSIYLSYSTMPRFDQVGVY